MIKLAAVSDNMQFTFKQTTVCQKTNLMLHTITMTYIKGFW